MKVKALIEELSKLNPEAEIAALIYDKAMFDFPEDDDFVLTEEIWNGIVADFEDDTFDDVWQTLHNAAIDNAEMRKDDE